MTAEEADGMATAGADRDEGPEADGDADLAADATAVHAAIIATSFSSE